MTATLTGPFGYEDVDEIPLSRAPLVKVLAQVQFPRLSALQGGPESVQAYATQMRHEYPILNEINNVLITITPEGVQQQPGPSKIWVLEDASGNWKVSMNDTFLTIETTSYTTRADFCRRFETALELFVESVSVPYVSRLGVRYINRFDKDADVAAVPKLYQSAVSGIVSAPLPSEARVEQSLSQTVYRIGSDDGLLARWGLLPPNAVTDAGLSPSPTTSFLLDLDAFREYKDRAPRGAAEVAADALSLSMRAYRYFRWAVTPEFLRHFGGEL